MWRGRPRPRIGTSCHLRKRSRSLSDSRRRIYAFASTLSFRQAKDEESAFLFADCAFGKGMASAMPPSRSFLLPEGAPAHEDRAAKSSIQNCHPEKAESLSERLPTKILCIRFHPVIPTSEGREPALI
jgi:hypothetical protein